MVSCLEHPNLPKSSDPRSVVPRGGSGVSPSLSIPALCSMFQTTNHTLEPFLTPQAVASSPDPLLVDLFQWIWPDSSHIPATWIPHVFSRFLPA